MQQPSQLYKTLDISKKTVLITGATAGIGWSTAQRFAELGCQLVLVGRRQEKLEELSQWISTTFPNTPAPELVKLDIQDVEAIKKLPETLKNPKVDILVNNAGLALGVDLVEDLNIEDVMTVLNTNVVSIFALCRVFLPGMKERDFGHIINISSVAGTEYYGTGSIYCASKAAINAYSISARFDLMETPLRVTTISPGLCETDFSKVRFKGDVEKANKVYQDIYALQPEDIADQIVYSATRPSNCQIADLKSYATNQAHAKYGVARLGQSMGAKNQQ